MGEILTNFNHIIGKDEPLFTREEIEQFEEDLVMRFLNGEMSCTGQEDKV
jgi:hypothetical protein